MRSASAASSVRLGTMTPRITSRTLVMGTSMTTVAEDFRFSVIVFTRCAESSMGVDSVPLLSVRNTLERPRPSLTVSMSLFRLNTTNQDQKVFCSTNFKSEYTGMAYVHMTGVFLPIRGGYISVPMPGNESSFVFSAFSVRHYADRAQAPCYQNTSPIAGAETSSWHIRQVYLNTHARAFPSLPFDNFSRNI